MTRSTPHGPLPALLIYAALAVSTAGCFAEGRCLSQEDCPGDRICINGECRDQCSSDDDCDPPFVCEDHLCALPAGCVGCNFDHAAALCDETSCAMGACAEGWFDNNGLPDDGCEYECTPTREDELCNEVDDDCDGVTDEDFDLMGDPDHCGDCDTTCTAGDHAAPACAGGICTYTCEDGWFDNNGLHDDGCEAEECVPVCAPVTVEPSCDNKDDDCDGETDEGWDKTAAESCGDLCVDCTGLYDNAAGLCDDAACAMGPCQDGWVDVDNSEKNGCECLDTGAEVCDGADNDCNGAIDDGLNCCPAGMVQVDPVPGCVDAVTKPFCVDRWEATLRDDPGCDGAAYGNPLWMGCNIPEIYPPGFPADVCSDTPCADEETPLYACTAPDVYPSRCVSWFQARRACQNVGKRLCTPEEWQLACHGAACAVYPYGDEFTWDVCNYIETFESYSVLHTGEMEECTNSWGVFDLSGNVWEYDSSGGGHVRGGAYNCNPAGAPALESCANVTTFADLMDLETGSPVGSRNNVGFRCCK